MAIIGKKSQPWNAIHRVFIDFYTRFPPVKICAAFLCIENIFETE